MDRGVAFPAKAPAWIRTRHARMLSRRYTHARLRPLRRSPYRKQYGGEMPRIVPIPEKIKNFLSAGSMAQGWRLS